MVKRLSDSGLLLSVGRGEQSIRALCGSLHLTISDAELTLGTPYHQAFSGPPNFNGLVPFVLSEIDQVITLGFSSQLHKSKIITHP